MAAEEASTPTRRETCCAATTQRIFQEITGETSRVTKHVMPHMATQETSCEYLKMLAMHLLCRHEKPLLRGHTTDHVHGPRQKHLCRLLHEGISQSLARISLCESCGDRLHGHIGGPLLAPCDAPITKIARNLPGNGLDPQTSSATTLSPTTPSIGLHSQHLMSE